MARRSGLGKGLDALIPTTPSTEAVPVSAPSGGSESPADETLLREVGLAAIHPNRFQPRTMFRDAELAELAESIRSLGVLQPLLVREDSEGGYELIAGERRLRAAGLAGLTTVPVVVRAIDDQAALEQALVENLQRSDLNAMEEATAFQQLIDEFAFTQDAVAERVGKSRSAVANAVRLLHLDPQVQAMVRDDQLAAGHARCLAGLDNLANQRALAGRAAREGWSVRQMEAEVKKVPGPRPARSGAPPTRSAAVLELERLLGEHLDTRVVVEWRGAGEKATGKIVITAAGLDDLERLYRVITDGRTPA